MNKTQPRPEQLLPAWWHDSQDKPLHVSDLIKDPELRKTLPIIDQLYLETELVRCGLVGRLS